MTERDEARDQDSHDDADLARREPSQGHTSSKSRKTPGPAKKSRLPRGSHTRSIKKSRAARSPKKGPQRGPAPEPPSIMSQPTIESYEESPPETTNRPDQEPPPPTASASQAGTQPGGDDDDLFEYVF